MATAKRLAVVSAPLPATTPLPVGVLPPTSFDSAATRLAATDFALPLSAEILAALQDPDANLTKKVWRNLGSRIDWDRRANASATAVRIVLPFVGLACQVYAVWQQPWTGVAAVPLSSGTAWLVYGSPARRRANRRLSTQKRDQESA